MREIGVMSDEQDYTRVMSRAEYDAAIAARKVIDENSVFIVEPLGDPEPLTNEEAERLADEATAHHEPRQRGPTHRAR
jgi:hypothetical protein